MKFAFVVLLFDCSIKNSDWCMFTVKSAYNELLGNI